jgi:ADP-ribosyl-[dinitrogen reductase] hydrolase
MRRTSLSHPLQIATVETLPGCGRIGVTFCPGKKDSSAMMGGWDRDLGLDLDAIAEWGAAVVVTLVEPFELDELKVPHIGEEVAHRHMDWLHLPIRDVSIPDEAFEAAWASAGPALHERLRDGQNVLVHCKGGLGHGGTIAANLLVELGKAPNEAIARVRAVRPGALETKAQEAYVAQRAPFAAPSPLASPDALEDRAIGALIGLAVGDAVGTTLEFRPRNDKAERHTQMIGGGPFRLKAGQWTDDTAMALALADSLTANPALDPRDLMRRFVQWWQQGTYSCTGECFDIGTRRARRFRNGSRRAIRWPEAQRRTRRAMAVSCALPPLPFAIGAMPRRATLLPPYKAAQPTARQRRWMPASSLPT